MYYTLGILSKTVITNHLWVISIYIMHGVTISDDQDEKASHHYQDFKISIDSLPAARTLSCQFYIVDGMFYTYGRASNSDSHIPNANERQETI